jgi:hypothetical protein
VAEDIPNAKSVSTDKDVTVTTSTEGETTGSLAQNEDTPVTTMSDAETSLTKKCGDIGPWMVMNYKNKKKNVNVANASTKKLSQGSRFTPLQDESFLNEPVVPPSVAKAKQSIEPPIVKLWKNLQHKLQTGNSKHNQPLKSATTSASVKFPPAKRDTKDVPLTDISNVEHNIAPGLNPPKKVSKNRGALAKGRPTTPMDNSSFPIVCDFDVGSSDSHPFLSMDAEFGHSPPEEAVESDMIINVDSHTHGDANLNVDGSTENADSVVRSLSSSNDEEMVVS